MKNKNVTGSGKADESGDVDSMPMMGTKEVSRPKQAPNCADVSGDSQMASPMMGTMERKTVKQASNDADISADSWKVDPSMGTWEK